MRKNEKQNPVTLFFEQRYLNLVIRTSFTRSLNNPPDSFDNAVPPIFTARVQVYQFITSKSHDLRQSHVCNNLIVSSSHYAANTSNLHKTACLTVTAIDWLTAFHSTLSGMVEDKVWGV
ncbi:hypothetical protein AVEN_173361-1 [Araneus ventricosus]|uniref:Uncharacterized protein n=1 Tax=Araneus ventricosus TaxID=182803 RepID=A0A4Y2IZN1_ARAVE|nr:hypothetical protein AVEN_69174-1 [Araneus ventricosus]GBM83327.1 hypothetical protein AVEN_173361-1 [Araneus ventricosus]